MEMVQLWEPALVTHHVTLPNALSLVATVHIVAGSELFYDYGPEYELFR